MNDLRGTMDTPPDILKNRAPRMSSINSMKGKIDQPRPVLSNTIAYGNAKFQMHFMNTPIVQAIENAENNQSNADKISDVIC